MNQNEYSSRLVDLFNDYEFNRKSIMREFALSRNELKVGDIFIDHIGPIQIEEIRICYISSPPQCVYYGIELKKDYTLKKTGVKRAAYQHNQVSFIKK
jgi:hypothetical protein